jgi:hypothetical protein
MRNTLAALWRDDAGSLDTTDWLVVSAILLLGTCTGLFALHQAFLSP